MGREQVKIPQNKLFSLRFSIFLEQLLPELLQVFAYYQSYEKVDITNFPSMIVAFIEEWIFESHYSAIQ
jgi:hypothetical protein